MSNLLLLADRETGPALATAVARKIGIDEPYLTMFDEVQAAISKAAADDVIVIAGSSRDAWLTTLLNAGFINVYDGDRMIAADRPAARLAALSRRDFLGPLPPEHIDPGAVEARRFQPRPVKAGAAPRQMMFIVNSMPKSGTLWITAMLEALLGVETRKQLIVSHVADLEVDWGRPNVQGAVTLVRDLRDVVVSWSHHAARTDISLGYRRPRYSTISSFYWEFFLPTLTTSERYYRGDLVAWLHRSAASYIPRVRYEDMLADPLAALEKVLNAWMVDYDEAAARSVAQASVFERMVQTGGPGDGYLAAQFRGGHLRRGVAGSWREELPVDVQRDISERFADYQDLLGYDAL